MSEPTKITLSVDLPEITETASRIKVQCGPTAVSVHEHGREGSGEWAVWTGSGGSIIDVRGVRLYPAADLAIAAARGYVRRRERSRLLHTQLNRLLEARHD